MTGFRLGFAASWNVHVGDPRTLTAHSLETGGKEPVGSSSSKRKAAILYVFHRNGQNECMVFFSCLLLR